MGVTVSDGNPVSVAVVRHVDRLFGPGAVSLDRYAIIGEPCQPMVIQISVTFLNIAPVLAITAVANSAVQIHADTHSLSADLHVNIYDLLGIEKESS